MAVFALANHTRGLSARLTGFCERGGGIDAASGRDAGDVADQAAGPGKGIWPSAKEGVERSPPAGPRPDCFRGRGAAGRFSCSSPPPSSRTPVCAPAVGGDFAGPHPPRAKENSRRVAGNAASRRKRGENERLSAGLAAPSQPGSCSNEPASENQVKSLLFKTCSGDRVHRVVGIFVQIQKLYE